MVEGLVSIIMPSWNTAKFIAESIQCVIDQTYQNWELLIVDDCSTDGTRDLLTGKLRSKIDKLIFHKYNQGKGAALSKGFQAATGDVVVIQDADLEYDPDEYMIVAGPVLNGEADVVYGSRFLSGKRKGYLANRLANRFLTGLSNLFTHQHLTDMETCYKCFRREVIQSIVLTEDRFGFEPEVTAKISAMGIRIREVPISYMPRTREEGKKIGLKDGLRAIYCIWKYRR